jgi:hypothetical protein
MTTRAKHFDQSGIKLIAKIAKEMDLPRETASVRNDGAEEIITVAGFALRNGKKCYYPKDKPRGLGA